MMLKDGLSIVRRCLSKCAYLVTALLVFLSNAGLAAAYEQFTPNSTTLLQSYATALLDGPRMSFDVELQKNIHENCAEDIQTYTRFPFASSCQRSLVPTMVVRDTYTTHFLKTTTEATVKMLNVTGVDRLMRWMGVGSTALNDPEQVAEGFVMTVQPGYQSAWVSLRYCY